MTLNKAVLYVDSDVDGDGTTENGEFHFTGNLEVTPSLRTGYLIGGRGSAVNNILSQAVGAGESKRKQFFLEAGGGAHTVEVNFSGWEGSETWGDPDEPVGSKANATGEQPVSQIDVLMQYLITAQIDSTNPAKLEYGEYSSSGRFEPLDVVIEGPQMTRAAEDGSWFDGTITFIAAADIRELLDAQSRRER